MSNKRSQLVLIGLGHGHLQVLRDWSQQVHKGVDLTVIAPATDFVYSGGLASWISGQSQDADIKIPVEALIRASGAKWVQDRCIALDANERTITLRNATQPPLRFDWLSVNTGSNMGLQQLDEKIPGARGRVLPVRPVEQFMDYWTRAIETAAQRPMAVSVIGAGASGVELALAIKHRLRKHQAQASVTLIAGRDDWLAEVNSPLRRQAECALRKAQIQVLTQRCTEVLDGELLLDNGMRLKSDLPIIASGNMPPPWLRNSGLNLDAHGYIAVNAHQQSTSHLRVFALGDVATRIDRPHAKNLSHVMKAGQVHAKTLWSAIQGLALTPVTQAKNDLQLIDTSDGKAIASWGNWSTSGRWVKFLKKRRDRDAMRILRDGA